MVANGAIVLWPAPGFPAFLEQSCTYLDVIVASRERNPEAIREWAQRIALTDRAGTIAVPLVLHEIAPAESEEIAERAAQFAALPSAKGLHYTRVRLHVPSWRGDGGPCAVQLFDLTVHGAVAQPRSVAILHQQTATLNLAFVCDLHVAVLWDDIAAAVDRYAPELGKSLVNPHRVLDRFVDEANSLAARGDLDLVVLGGDLVDHVHAHPRQKGSDGTAANVRRLLAMLNRLAVPTLAVPGNHDHRCYPRRPRSSGLEVVGIPREQGRSLLRRAGLWDRWPLSRLDLDALRVTDAAGTPGLSEYLRSVAPATDYSCTVRGLRLLFASSGCDILAKWREVERARWGLLVGGLRTARAHPASEGFSEGQLVQIRRRLRGSHGSALFFHAPLLASRAGARVEERLTQLLLEGHNSLTAQVRFERHVQRVGLGAGVGLRNSGALIQALSAASGPVATFSGHIHRPSAIEIDRHTMHVRSIDPDLAAARSHTITLLTAPALGQLSPGDTGRPGYLLARFVDGALVSVQQRSLFP